MYKENYEKTDMDVLLKSVAKAENESLPFDEWKSNILNVAAKTPEHETELLSIFEKSSARKRKITARITYGVATCAAALLIMLTLNLNKKALRENQLYGDAAPAAEAPSTASQSAGTVESPMAAALDNVEEEEARLEMAMPAEINEYAEPEEGSIAPGSGAVPDGLEDEAMQAVSEYLNDSKREKGSEQYAAEFFANEWFDVILAESGEQAHIMFEYAYVVTLSGGERYLVDASTFAVYPLCNTAD